MAPGRDFGEMQLRVISTIRHADRRREPRVREPGATSGYASTTETIFLPGSSLTRPRGGWNVPTAFDPSAYCTLLRAACAGAKPDASLSAAWYSAIAAERSPIL